MRTKVGLWIDHRKALIVAVTDKGEEIRLIISKVEKQPGRSGGIRSTTPYESQLVPADDSRERRSTGLLNIYYNAVIACIRDAESILIFGPGEAKGELKKRLVRNKLGGRIVGIETIDRMTDRQIRRKFDGTSKKTAPGNRIEIEPPTVRSADDVATCARLLKLSSLLI
jgi:hypothetical protein